MDNITHSLVGVTVGLAITRLPKVREQLPQYLSALLWAAIIGNNFPDLDFMTAIFTGGGRFNYLLQHRGYTHTFFFAPFEALFVVAIAALLVGWKKSEAFSRKHWIFLYAVAIGSIGLHIGADFCNDYGVHPFAPFWPRWFYGGILFIVEPLLWAAMIPLLVFGFSSKKVRGLGLALSALFLGLLWSSSYIALSAALWTSAFFAVMLFWQWRRSGVAQPLVGVLLSLGLFAFTGHAVEREIRTLLLQEHPEEKLTQLVTTPSPGNPFCWRVIPVSFVDPEAMGIQSTGMRLTPFFERLGVVSLWPAVFPPQSCFLRMRDEHAAPLVRTSLPASGAVEWIGEFRGTTEELAFQAKSFCRFDQFLRFARVPFWKKTGDTLIVGDLRYDNGGASFAQFAFQTEQACLPRVPNWGKPSGLLPDHH